MHPHRRRKKRPNYGVRTVEVSRGNNGFGFTISGQQPCILSCIVTESPAEVAGLRAGDFLISVNGTNVSKLPHDAVVNLIGNSEGAIRMAIAENYFSDSSDEELFNGRSVQSNRQRPKYPHSNKSRAVQRCKGSNFHSNVVKTANNVSIDQDTSVDFKSSGNNSSKDNLSSLKGGAAHCVIINPSVKNNNDISNVSAMINPGPEQTRAIKVIRDLRTGAMFEPSLDTETPSSSKSAPFVDCAKSDLNQSTTVEARSEAVVKMMEKVECRAVVGYLGTIEMPKQIATSSKLQTVRSCVRKMRQEKRTPCTVLMTILPSCMVLRNSSGEILAEYPAKRINYVSCNSENDYRFFGLVTSATYPVDVNDYEMSNSNGTQKEYDIAISNSCHVFMIDGQIIDHKSHIKKAEIFKINCTIDPVSGMCLEFPNNSEYIVNLIRIMYSLKPPNGFTMKGNIENISRLSNLGRKSCSPRGANFVRKVNRPKFFHESRLRHRLDHYVNPHVRPAKGEQENGARNLIRQDPDPGLMNGNAFVANSPQPSNHSEITTTSSNSDSGIGFHNDCQNISDRILVVDFPNPIHNNFNLNAPHAYPAFHRDPQRDNPNRPMGMMGLNPDMDGHFLSNTTPVVEGFSGLGRPLNHGDPILLGNLPSQPTLQNTSIFISKSNENEASTSSCTDKHSVFAEHNSPQNSNSLSQYSLTDSQKQSVLDKLAVRAMPSKFVYNEKLQDFNKSKKVNVHDHSMFHHRSRSEDSPHYDPVYNEGLVCSEEHHYEIIHPEENNMCNENVANNKKCSKTLVYVNNEFRHKYTNELPYTEKPVDVPDYDIDYYMVEGDQLNNSSVATFSYDDMSVTSSKSQDCSAKKSNFSVDDISLYSSKSHDEVVANPSKLKQKVHKLQTSMDDILIFGKHSKSKNSPKYTQKAKDDKGGVFLHPGNVKLRGRKGKKSSMFSKLKSNLNASHNCEESQKSVDIKDSIMKYKLSPKVFGLSRPSTSVEDIRKSSSRRDESKEVTWGHLEGTASEPDLRDCRSNFKGSGGSPFGRWAGGSGRALAQRPHSTRRPATLTNSEHDMYTKQQQCEADNNSLDDNSVENGPTSWAVSFERLLSDACGVHALSAFLEQEFSAENIHFWTACERYARASPQARPAIAAALLARHFAEGAPEPVNVDSHARQLALERLSAAPPDLFLQAQKQIFNLMKFDSYPRFIKSDIHKECLLAKLQGRDPPYPGDPELNYGNDQHTPSPKGTNLKKSLSNAEDRRRKSLLPWHRKLRSKSRDRWYEGDNCEDGRSIGEGTGDGDRSENNSEKDPHGSNSSLLTGWDVTKALNVKNCGPACACDDHKLCNNNKQGNALCRVRLPHAAASSSVVAVGGGSETVRDLIDKLLRKRALTYLAYEVYVPGSSKAIDVNQSSSVLAGEEVTVEQRVIFKLDLPNRKVISVKSKPNKLLGDVLKPILHKYGVGASGGLCVTLGSTMLELTQPVQAADGQRLHVALRSVDQAELTKAIHMKTSQENNNCVTNNNNNITSTAPSLDEITNRVFEELLQGKADKHSTNIGEDSIKSDNCSSEHSSGIFGRFLRRDDHRNKGVKIKKSNPPNVHLPHSAMRTTTQSVSSEGGSSCCMEDGTCNAPQKPLIAKLRAGVRIQNAVGVPTELENTEFLENLKQIQRARLKDKLINGGDNTMVNGQDQQVGKENQSSDRVAARHNTLYELRTTNQNFVNGLPVATQRITSPVSTQPIVKPSPAPRLSLGQGSPNKITVINIKQDPKIQNDINRVSGDFSPTKSGFNSLDNTVIEKCNPDASSKSSDNVNKDRNCNKYQINLAQDYLSSSTSCSDGFARNCDMLNSSFHSTGSSCENEQLKNGICDPPPLPPKPKILPIKPSNWGHTLSATDDARMQEISLPDVGVKEIVDRNKTKQRTVYLDQPSSSFV